MHSATGIGDCRAAQLLDEAATAAMRVVDLPGWSQTRLAGSLRLRREVVNAIINRGPSAEPSESRPRMAEACRKIIAFAAVISQKDDAVVPCEINAAEQLDDDAHAYECHKVRLRRLVEDAATGRSYLEAMFRVGELSSHALHAPPRFRVRMIGNVVTAIQRLLDKPGSRAIPLDVLRHNLKRLTAAEWSARRAARATAPGERAKAADDFAYIRGQVGYAMIFNGLLAGSEKALRRGGRRLRRAARLQPSPDYGHWSNLLRAINDLLASGHPSGPKWAVEVAGVAEGQRHPGSALAFTRLRETGELKTLIAFWDEQRLTGRIGTLPDCTRDAARQAPAAPRKRKTGTTAAAILLLVGLLTAPAVTRAGDGKELSSDRNSAGRATPAGRGPLPFRGGPSAAPVAMPFGRTADASAAFGGPVGRPSRSHSPVSQPAPLSPVRQPRMDVPRTAPNRTAPTRFAPQVPLSERVTADGPVLADGPFHSDAPAIADAPDARPDRGQSRTARRRQHAGLRFMLAREVHAAEARARAEAAERASSFERAGGVSREDDDLTRLPLRIDDQADVVVVGPPPAGSVQHAAGPSPDAAQTLSYTR